MQENEIRNVIRKMAAILSQAQCANSYLISKILHVIAGKDM